jgi:Family of unknown function (DUF5715)
MSWMAAHVSAFATRTARATATLLLGLSLSATAFARSHRHDPPLRLFTTAGSLEAQNAEANRLRLPRIQNANELHELVQDGELVPIRTSDALRTTLKGEHATLRPWAEAQLEALTQQSGFPLYVSSTVRTLRDQAHLRRWNRNAAATTGATASVHPTGIAFDIAKRRLSRSQQLWLQWRLFYLQATGQVIVEEEFKQPCFHVVVIKQ